MNAIRVVIPGATGKAGVYALRYMLDHPDVGRVTAIRRRKLATSVIEFLLLGLQSNFCERREAMVPQVRGFWMPH